MPTVDRSQAMARTRQREKEGHAPRPHGLGRGMRTSSSTTTDIDRVQEGKKRINKEEKESSERASASSGDHIGEHAAVLGHLDERPVEVADGVLGGGLPELLVAVLHVLRRHAHGGADGDAVLEDDGALAGAEVVAGVQVEGLAQVQRPLLLRGGGLLGLLLRAPARRPDPLLERVHLHPQDRQRVHRLVLLRVLRRRPRAQVRERRVLAHLRHRRVAGGGRRQLERDDGRRQDDERRAGSGHG
jgi:hypothetical protein